MQNKSYLPTFAIALSTLAMLWLSFPPVGIWWLAWLAPIPLIGLVARAEFPSSFRLTPRDGNGNGNGQVSQSSTALELNRSRRRHYWMLYWAGLAYWLGTFYFIPFPHPALWLGWLAISLYMAIYTPLTVGASRVLVHRYRIPVVVAVPIAWTGLEWFRSNFATGMAMVCLSHSQFRHVGLIQVADLFGGYTLTFAMTGFAAGLAIAFFPSRWITGERWTASNRFSNGIVSLLVALGVWGYGQARLAAPVKQGENRIEVALIQSSFDVVFEPQTQEQAYQQDLELYELTLQAIQESPEVDLIVWPESSLRLNDLLSDYNADASTAAAAESIASFWQVFAFRRNDDDLNLLVGSTTFDPERMEVFNSALLIQRPGLVTGRYFKNHRVVLGEYVPLADWFPFLQEMTPIGRGLTAGREFTTFEIDGLRLAPSICFETTVPHLVRRMVRTLERQLRSPDAIVNLTNDGWFFGSSCLDLHLACNVFRAVEVRKPMLVCANTGLSAHIDAWGRLLTVGPRRERAVLYAEVRETTGLRSVYLTIGDWIPAGLGLLSLGVLLIARFSPARDR